jgi:hypothetical protein
MAWLFGIIALLLFVGVMVAILSTETGRIVMLVLALIIGGGGYYFYKENKKDAARALTLVKPSEVEVAGQLRSWKNFEARVTNNSAHTITEMTFFLQFMDCPEKVKMTCSIIGEETVRISTNIPPKQIRDIKGYSSAPSTEAKGKLEWAFSIKEIKAH